MLQAYQRNTRAQKAKVVIIGGAGEVGRILCSGLSEQFDITTLDIQPKPENWQGPYTCVDATDFKALTAAIPEDTDALINLLKLEHTFSKPGAVPDDQVGTKRFAQMTNIYLNAGHNIYQAAVNKNIPKVVVGSTNHVTGQYEKNGHSLIGTPQNPCPKHQRAQVDPKITEQDYPLPDSPYGAMKLALEEIGRLFTQNHTNFSVIQLRIATLTADELKKLNHDPRSHHTLLSQKDAIDIFTKALKTTSIEFGIYNAVSDNPNRPWSIQKAIDELGYTPTCNSLDILKTAKQRNKGLSSRVS